MHYLQGTKHFRVHYVASSALELVGFTDSNWAGDSIDKNSTSGYVIMISYGLMFFPSKNQHTISLSSVEAEYRGVVNTNTQCVWLQGILGELGFSFDSPTVIWCDNKSEINISTDPV